MVVKLSIIVSMYNKKQETLEIIDNLFFPSLINNATKEMQFILIDDASPLSSETQKIVKKYTAQLKKLFGQFLYLKNKTNLGFAGSYNRGMSLAIAPLILVTNDDVYFPIGSIAKLTLAAQNDKTAGAIGPVTNCASAYQNTQLFKKLKSYSKSEIQRIEKFAIWLSKIMKGKTYSVNKLIGFCLIYKKDVLNKTGFFDTQYIYGNTEDDDLNLKITQAGYSLKVIGDVFIEHGGIKGGHASIMQRPVHTAIHYVLNCLKFGLAHKIFLKSLWIAYIRNPAQELGYFTITKEIEKHRKMLKEEKF